jgi:hypothetical protein
MPLSEGGKWVEGITDFAVVSGPLHAVTYPNTKRASPMVFIVEIVPEVGRN